MILYHTQSCTDARRQGQKQMELVQAALKQRMGPSYTERDAMKLIPLIVVDMDRHDLEELLSSEAFEDVRELMSSAVIEPDGVVSIPELPQQDVQGLTTQQELSQTTFCWGRGRHPHC